MPDNVYAQTSAPALLEFRGRPATQCVASSSHDPEPLRFVWHHVQPQGAGGETVESNLAELCDSCHYTIHRLLWYLAQQHRGVILTDAQEAELAHPPRRRQRKVAQQGFDACVAAGTVPAIANEG
jgi:hypothetical protein